MATLQDFLNILRNCQTVFQSDYTILHFHKQCMIPPISPCLHQYLLLSVVFIITNPMGVKWYLIIILICTSLVTNDIGHLFMCLLTICISSLEKWLFRSFAHFKICAVFLILSYKNRAFYFSSPFPLRVKGS